MKRIFEMLMISCCVIVMGGCVTSGNGLPSMSDSVLKPDEVEWIRNGEPIRFEGEDWYPTREVENLLDSEVYQIGVSRDIPFFVEKTDVKPWSRLYTRFARNRFRAFEKQPWTLNGGR